MGQEVKTTLSGSINSGINTPLLKIPILSDTITPMKYTSSPKIKYDSITQPLVETNKITQITDSISRLINKPIDKVNSFEDSVRRRAQSFSQKLSTALNRSINKPIDKLNSKVSNVIDPVETKVDAVENRAEQKVDAVESKVQDGVKTATDGNVNAPIQKLTGDKIKIPESDVSIEKIGLKSTAAPGSKSEINELNIKDKIDIPKSDLNVDALKQKAKTNITGSDKTAEIKKTINDNEGKLGEVKKYGSEVKGVATGDSASVAHAEKRLEDRVARMDQLQEADKQKQAFLKQQQEYKAMMHKYQDKKLLKDEITRKSRNVVTAKLTQLTPAFEKGQQQIAKAKKINGDVQNYKGGKVKRENEMSSLKFSERLVPGITIQVLKNQNFEIDWGLQAGFKITRCLLAGAGAIYRVSVNENYPKWVKSPGIYGYRSYGNFLIAKGFYLHGELESLHWNSFIHPGTKLEVPAQQVYNANVGIGKRYDLTKKIRGSAIVLYKVEVKGDVPSASKISVRIGFDLNTKKSGNKKSIK